MAARKSDKARSLTLIEVMLSHAKDQTVHFRRRGAPLVKKHASPLLLGKNIEEVSRDDMDSMLTRFMSEAPLRRKGVRLIEDINGLMRWSILNGFRTTPWEPLKRPKPSSPIGEIITHDKVNSILEAVDSLYPDNLTIRIAIRALLCLGLGVQETANFSLSRVDYKRQEYCQDDKRGRYRIIPIPASMGAILAMAWQYKEGLQPEGPTTKPWIPIRDLKSLVKRLGTHCGIEGLLPSTLQRTAIHGK